MDTAYRVVVGVWLLIAGVATSIVGLVRLLGGSESHSGPAWFIVATIGPALFIASVLVFTHLRSVRSQTGYNREGHAVATMRSPRSWPRSLTLAGCAGLVLAATMMIWGFASLPLGLGRLALVAPLLVAGCGVATIMEAVRQRKRWGGVERISLCIPSPGLSVGAKAVVWVAVATDTTTEVGFARMDLEAHSVRGTGRHRTYFIRTVSSEDATLSPARPGTEPAGPREVKGWAMLAVPAHEPDSDATHGWIVSQPCASWHIRCVVGLADGRVLKACAPVRVSAEWPSPVALT